MSDYEPKCKKTLPIIFDDRMPVNNLTPKLVGRVNDNTEDLKNLYEETDTMQGDIDSLQDDVDGKLDIPETAGTAGQVLTSDGEGGAVWAEVGAGEIVVDPTLTVEGAAADAKKTGDEITHLKQDNNELKSQLNFNKTATPGYVLRATNTGNGSEWAQVGTPTDAQTASAVTAWLNAHPEATTTVQDHSLTIDKIVIGALDYVTPEMYGARGNGVNDDSSAFQNAINSKLPVVLSKEKTYLIHNVDIATDTIILGFGATIKPAMKTGSQTRYETAFSADSAIDVMFYDIDFEGYNNIASDSAAQETLLDFSNLNGLIIRNCVFNSFRQPGATISSDFVDRTGVVLTGLDIKQSEISNCTISNCTGKEIIWILPKVLDREEMDFVAINNVFKANGITVVDFIGNNAILNGNKYIDPDPNSSGINIFALNASVTNEYWEADTIEHAYDFTEGGRFHCETVSITNVVFDTVIHNAYNDGFAVGIKSTRMSITNCYVKECDIFARRYGFIPSGQSLHKDTDTTDMPKMDLTISNCEINYTNMVISGAAYNNASNSTVRVNECVINPIDYDTAAGSLLYVLAESYYITKNRLGVKLNTNGTYSVIDLSLSPASPSRINVSNNIIDVKSESSACFFYGTRFVCPCVFTGNQNNASGIKPVISGAENLNLTLAKNIGFNNYVTIEGALSGGYYTITMPPNFQSGTLTVQNSSDSILSSTLFTFDINRAMIESGEITLRSALMVTGVYNAHVVVNVTTSTASLRIFTIGTNDYKTDTNTTFKLIFS